MTDRPNRLDNWLALLAALAVLALLIYEVVNRGVWK